MQRAVLGAGSGNGPALGEIREKLVERSFYELPFK